MKDENAWSKLWGQMVMPNLISNITRHDLDLALEEFCKDRLRPCLECEGVGMLMGESAFCSWEDSCHHCGGDGFVCAWCHKKEKSFNPINECECG